MVRRDSPGGSRERLLAAAAAEFAARGFDGAKVDRIAARARVNKAMLYYHFRSKAALYRQVLHDVFGEVAAAVADATPPRDPPEERIRRFVAAVAAVAASRPHFPAIWLREIAEGGRHVGPDVVAEIGGILRTLGRILDDGRRRGRFRRLHPFIVQTGIVGPLLFFAASAAVRERFGHAVPYPLANVPVDTVVAHVQAMTLAALRPSARGRPESGRRPRASRRPVRAAASSRRSR